MVTRLSLKPPAITETNGGIGVGVGVGVNVAVGVGASVGVGVRVGVRVTVGVGVIVGVRVTVGVGVIVGVGVTVGVSVGGGTGVNVGVGVGDPRLMIGGPPNLVSLRSSSMTGNCKPDIVHGPAAVCRVYLRRVDANHLAVPVDKGASPLLPGFIAASVCSRSIPSNVLVEDMIPRVTVRLLPILSASGKPSASTSSPTRAPPGSPTLIASNRSLLSIRKTARSAASFLSNTTAVYWRPLVIRTRTLLAPRTTCSIGHHQPIRTDNEARPAAVAYDNLHDPLLNPLDEVRK